MKKCQTCNNENSDEMRFCLNCGSPLPDAPIMVNFGGGSQGGQSNPGTNPYGKSMETQFGGRPQQPQQQQQQQNYSMVPPAKQGGGGSKKILIAVGGVVALFLLIFVAVAGIVGYNMMKNKNVVTTNSPTPSPSSSSSSSPSTSPSASPSSSKAVVSTPKDSESPTTTTNFDNVKAKFSKVWVDYNKTEDDELGMKVHLKFEVTKMKGVDSFAVIYFEKSDNTFLDDGIGEYRGKDGRVAAFKALKPGFDPTVYEDLEIFMPYSKLNLDSGKYKLKMDIDLTDNDENLIKHLTFKDFEYEKD